MSDDNLMFIEQWGNTDPVKWILEEPDGQVMNGRVEGGKYDGLGVAPARDPRLTITWNPDAFGGSTP